MDQFLEIPSLEKHYSENPESIVFAFLAFRNLEQGNPDKALTICEKGVRSHPEYPFGHFVLGLCHYHLKNYSKAKAHLEIATAFDDKNPQAWKLLGEINEQLDLPILADECNLKYYLIDSFNSDALEKYQKGEIIDFDVFKREGGYDFTPPHTSTGIEQQVTEIIEEKAETTPLDENFEEDKETTISVKKDSYMEEITRDISETDEDKMSESFSEGSEAGETREEPEESVEDSHRQVDELEAEKFERDEFSEGTTDQKIQRGFEETGSEGTEELLDFRSVVKNIISENEDDDVDLPKEEPASEMNIHQGEAVSETPLPEEETEVAKLGRPPILTPTIGEIYIAQGRFNEAIDVFEQLLEKDPDNQKFQRKIKDIRSIIEKQNT